MLALRSFQAWDCDEEDVRILESKRFEDTNSTVFVVSACGPTVEIEESLEEGGEQTLDSEEIEILQASLESATLPADVRRRGRWLSSETRESVYLGSDLGGDQQRRRYWFKVGRTVYFVTHRLSRPKCDHHLHEPRDCPL